MENNDLKKVKTKSLWSAASLFLQSSYSAILGFGAFFILTIKSGTHLLGIYNTVLASMSFFSYITNLGLAAALIQKKDTQQIDLNSAFYTQIVLVGIAVGVGFFFSDEIIAQFQDLPPNAEHLYWALLAALFILSFKTIPSVLMEKQVEIYKIVLAQIVENSLFYLIIIGMVYLNYELEALIIATLARALVGTIIIYFLHPWKPTFSLSFRSIYELLKYGIPFQGNSFLAMIKDDLLIIYLGSTIGFEKLGIVSFGKKYAEMAIRLITDNVNRVSFSLFARVQDSAEHLKQSVEKVLFYNSFIVFPIILGGLFVFDSFLKIIPGNYYDKWEPALFSFYFFSLSALLVSMTTPFINLFNAIKKVGYSILFMILWVAILWILIPIGLKFYDYNIISVAFLIMSLTFIFVLLTAKHLVSFSFFHTLKGVWIASAAMIAYLTIIRFVSLTVLQNMANTNEIHLIFSLIGAPLIYAGVLISVHGWDFIKDVFTAMRPTNLKEKEPIVVIDQEIEQTKPL